jgi:hypothetical protein
MGEILEGPCRQLPQLPPHITLQGPRLNQFRRAIVADQGAFVRDKPEPEIEADRASLIGQIRDNAVAAEASRQPFRRGRIGDDICNVPLTGHVRRCLQFHWRLGLARRRPSSLSLYSIVYIAGGKPDHEHFTSLARCIETLAG